MEVKITENTLAVARIETEKLFENIIRAEVVRYLHNNFIYKSDRPPYLRTGDKGIDLAIRDIISLEVQGVIRLNIDKIIKKSISQTANSIRSNPRYDELRSIIVEMLREEEPDD